MATVAKGRVNPWARIPATSANNVEAFTKASAADNHFIWMRAPGYFAGLPVNSGTRPG